MRVLAIGDIFGRPGRRAVAALLPGLRRERDLDLVVANAENAAGGVGVTAETGRELLGLGIDILTSGNHVWAKREAYDYLDSEPRILRPANYPEGAPGRGFTLARTRTGAPVGVVNLSGRVFLVNGLGCPFRAALAIAEELRPKTRVLLVDFHAEATSEKVALGYYLDGRVSAVFGTHTHVQTSDVRVLPKGTGYITDLGMTGPVDSVIGVEKEIVVESFLSQLPAKFEVASGPASLQGAIFDIDEASGLASRAEAIHVTE